MTKEKFLEVLVSQYRAEIDEMIIESEHIYRSTIDYELLDTKMNQLLQCARIDGLEEKIVWELIQARIPTYLNYINYKNSKKKAA